MHKIIFLLSLIPAITPARVNNYYSDNLAIMTDECSFAYKNQNFNLDYEDFEFARTEFSGFEKIVGVYNEDLINIEIINFKAKLLDNNNASYSLKIFDVIDSCIVEFYSENTIVDYLFNNEQIDFDSRKAQDYINRESDYITIHMQNAPSVYSTAEIDVETLEEMTSTDQYFDNYSPGGLPIYVPEYDRMMYPSDTALTRLIPQEYFYNTGVYHYFGKEYGFYVRTYNPTFVNGFYFHHSEVFMFDVDYEFNSSYSDYYKIKITPKFNFLVRCGLFSENPTNKWNNSYLSRDITINFDDILDNYIIDCPKLFFGMENRNALNYGDEGYNGETDNGSFVSDVRLGMCGIHEQNADNTGETALKFAFAAGNLVINGLSLLSQTVSTITTLISVVTNASNVFTLGKGLLKSNSNIETEYYLDSEKSGIFNTRSKHIENYGRICKTALFSMEYDQNDYRYFHANGDSEHFLEMNIETNIPNEDYQFVEQNICFDYNFNLKIKNGNNITNLLLNNGRHEYLGAYDSLFNCFNTNYLRSYALASKESLYISIQASYHNNRSCYLFTHTSNVDIRFYDRYMNDISSKYNFYKVSTKTYIKNTGNDEDLAIIKIKNLTTLQNNITFKSSQYSDINNGTNRVSANTNGFTYSFLPLETRTYSLETNFGIDVDTCIYVYNNNMILLDYNDDSDEAYELNSYLTIYLEFGETYYIKITSSDSFTTNGDLYVRKI